MVGVARIELATPAMSKPFSTTIFRLFFNMFAILKNARAQRVPKALQVII